MAACMTTAQAAPPPNGIRAKIDSLGMPRFRATSISSLESMLNVTSPSTARAARGSADERHPREDRQPGNAEVPRDVHLVARVHAERHEPVDVARREAGV